jgi:ribosomal protein L34
MDVVPSSASGVAVIRRPHLATCRACGWSARSATAAGAVVLAESHQRTRHGR